MGLVEYLQSEGIPVRKAGPSAYKACCPFHDDSTPSFHIYPDGRAFCYGSCWKHFDLVDVIRHNEHLSISQAVVRAREFGWTNLFIPTQHDEPVEPTLDHIEVMTIAFEVYHEFLMDPKIGKPAQDWLTNTRGLQGPHQNEVMKTLGYAPAGAKYTMEVVDRLRHERGEDWRLLAVQTGILTEGGKHRLQGRVLAACLSDEEVTCYQGRVIEERDGVAKYLNAPLRKERYCPTTEAEHPGTFVVEGYLDALAYAVCGFYSEGLLGSHIPSALPTRWKSPRRSPVLSALDNDPGEDDSGPKANRALLTLCESEQMPAKPVPFPPSIKDPSEWLKHSGPDAFIRDNQELLQAA